MFVCLCECLSIDSLECLAENVDISFEQSVEPSLLFLQHDPAQVSPLAWGKGHFEEWKSNTGIWAGPLSHRGY